MHGRPDAASQQPHPSTWLEGFVTWRPKKTHPVLRTFSLVWNSFVKNTPWISVFTRRWPVPRQKTDVYSEDRGLGALKRMRDDGIFVWWPWLSTSYGYHFLWEVCSKEVLTTYFLGVSFFFPWLQWWAFPKKQDGNHEPECSHVILRWTGHDQYNCALVDIFCLCPMTVRIAAADQCQDGLDKASLLHEFGLFWIPKTAANALSICLQRFCLDSFQILWKEWNWESHS